MCIWYLSLNVASKDPERYPPTMIAKIDEVTPKIKFNTVYPKEKQTNIYIYKEEIKCSNT